MQLYEWINFNINSNLAQTILRGKYVAITDRYFVFLNKFFQSRKKQS